MSCWNVEFWITKYNMTHEEATEKVKKIQKINNKKHIFKPDETHFNINYWINRYKMNETEAIEMVSNIQVTNSSKSKKFKGKHHSEESKLKISYGMKQMISSLNDSSWVGHLSTKGYSKGEKNLYRYIKDNINSHATANVNISFENFCYNVDILYDNIIVEFFGDYWHMNPSIFSENDINKSSKKKAIDIWKKDNIRITDLKNAGYDVKIIWEQDWLTNSNKVIEENFK